MKGIPYPDCLVCGKPLFCRSGRVHNRCVVVDCPHTLGGCKTCYDFAIKVAKLEKVADAARELIENYAGEFEDCEAGCGYVNTGDAHDCTCREGKCRGAIFLIRTALAELEGVTG